MLRFVAMGGGKRCWLEKEKKMGETVWRELLFGGGGLWPKEVDVGVVGKGRRGALVSLPREGRRLQEDERTGRGLPPVWF